MCAAAFNTGGTIDGIDTAACLLDESTARLYAVRGVTAPEAMLKGTDSMDPDQLSWYTTPEGSRIAEINTQGDQTGGAIVAWVIVGGADGFVVNPKQFYFQDGSFTDTGIVEPPNPAYHRVPTSPGVSVLYRLLHFVQGPQREQERRGLSLRAGHSGRPVALTSAPGTR